MKHLRSTAQHPFKLNAPAFVFLCCAVIIALVGALPNNGSILQRMMDDHQAHGAQFAHLHVMERMPLKLACDDQSSLHCGANLLFATAPQMFLFIALHFEFEAEPNISPTARRFTQDPPPPRFV